MRFMVRVGGGAWARELSAQPSKGLETKVNHMGGQLRICDPAPSKIWTTEIEQDPVGLLGMEAFLFPVSGL